MESLWSSTANLPSFPALPGSLKTDVLIIGGGIAGVLCAHELQKRGVDYALIEASEICSGITKCTTAKITAQHGLIYASLFDRLGKEKAALYLRANLQAIEAYEALAQTIDCDFERKDAFVYTQRSPKKIQEEAAALQLLGYPVQIDHELPLPIPILSAIRFASQAQFHPLKFIAGIAAPLHIYEHTQALELTRRGVQTSRGEIQAKKIIVATHFPIYNRHGFYPVKLYQERSYVLALKDAQDVGGMYIDEAKGGLSFRNADGLLLLGGVNRRPIAAGRRPLFPQRRRPAAFGRRFTPHGKEHRRLGSAGIFGRAVLSQGEHQVPLGDAGLHAVRQCPLYWPVCFRPSWRLCRHRLPEMGHEYCHALLPSSGRFGYREGKPVCPSLYAQPKCLVSAACHQRL